MKHCIDICYALKIVKNSEPIEKGEYTNCKTSSDTHV